MEILFSDIDIGILIGQYLRTTEVNSLKCTSKEFDKLINLEEIIKGIYMPLFEKFIRIQQVKHTLSSIKDDNVYSTIDMLVKYTILCLKGEKIVYRDYNQYYEYDIPEDTYGSFGPNTIKIRTLLIGFF